MKAEAVMRTNTTVPVNNLAKIPQQESTRNSPEMTEKNASTPNLAMTESGVTKNMVESGERRLMGSNKEINSNPDTLQIINYAESIKTVPLSWLLVTLYHESKFKQFKEDGSTVKSGSDYGIGQINILWKDASDLKDEGIKEVDFEKIKSDWKYNIQTSNAILSHYKKQLSETDPDIKGYEKFIATYAKYNGGPQGYKKYIEGNTNAGKQIASHIDGPGGLVADINNLIKYLEKEVRNLKKQYNVLSNDQKGDKQGTNLILACEKLNSTKAEIEQLKAHSKK